MSVVSVDIDCTDRRSNIMSHSCHLALFLYAWSLSGQAVSKRKALICANTAETWVQTVWHPGLRRSRRGDGECMQVTS